MNSKGFNLNWILIVAAALFALTGCGDPVSKVKDGTLNDYKQTTVGNAFDTFFSDVKWEAKSTENKTEFVEFSGKAKKPISIIDGDILVIPANAKVVFQFILNKDDSFNTSYAEAPLVVNEGLGAGAALAKMILLPSLAAQGIKVDGTTPVKLQPEAMNLLISHIYNGAYLNIPSNPVVQENNALQSAVKRDFDLKSALAKIYAAANPIKTSVFLYYQENDSFNLKTENDWSDLGYEKGPVLSNEISSYAISKTGVITQNIASGVIADSGCSISYTPFLTQQSVQWTLTTTCPEPAKSIIVH